tara:strand:- start:204 stop:353 length:150 start_codon:yes stop_codon:yes gene_type:complete
LRKKNKIPNYLKEILKKYPEITSGRKNIEFSHERIKTTLNLIKKYFKKN